VKAYPRQVPARKNIALASGQQCHNVLPTPNSLIVKSFTLLLFNKNRYWINQKTLTIHMSKCCTLKCICPSTCTSALYIGRHQTYIVHASLGGASTAMQLRWRASKKLINLRALLRLSASIHVCIQGWHLRQKVFAAHLDSALEQR